MREGTGVLLAVAGFGWSIGLSLIALAFELYLWAVAAAIFAIPTGGIICYYAAHGLWVVTTGGYKQIRGALNDRSGETDG